VISLYLAFELPLLAFEGEAYSGWTSIDTEIDANEAVPLPRI
jgi:hypothetical protein